MTTNFQRAETIVCELEVRSSLGVLVDPSSLPKLDITDPLGVLAVTAQSMTKTVTGKYYYNYTPVATAALGWYGATFTVTDGGLVTIKQDGFNLEASA